MNYQIISDESKLKDFIDNFLPDLKKGEQFYVSLLCRKKYWPFIKADKGLLKRVTATKENLIDKIRQWECLEKTYKTEGVGIPNEALAVYIMPNPRSLDKAGKNLLIKLANLVVVDYNNYNPHKEALNEIQKAKSRTVYVGFDFDNYSPDIKEKLELTVNKDALHILRTRGGAHVFIQPDKVDKQYQKTWHQAINKLGADISGDMLMPVPGTNQGGFAPHFL